MTCGASGKESTCQCRRYKRCWIDPWVRQIPWRRAHNPLQYSCLETSMDQGGWWVTVHVAAESQTQLKRLSSSSSSSIQCFPGSSAGKESTCNAGDPSSIPGSGRSPGEGKSYPLQRSWATLVAQMVKNPFAMQETPVRFLGQEDPQEKG